MAPNTGVGVFPSAANDNKNLCVEYLMSGQLISSIYLQASRKVNTRGFRVACIISFGQLVTGGSRVTTERFVLKNRVQSKNDVQLKLQEKPVYFTSPVSICFRCGYAVEMLCEKSPKLQKHPWYCPILSTCYPLYTTNSGCGNKEAHMNWSW